MLQWHLSPLGSYISTNKRFFNVRAPGGVWGVLGTVVAGICQSPVQAVEACCSGGSAPGPASAVGRGMWCPTRRAEQGWAARKRLFQATSLPWGCVLQSWRSLAPGLWVTVPTPSHQAGFWAHWDSDPSVIHPICMLDLGLQLVCKGQGGEVGRDWLRPGSGWAVVMQAGQFLPFPGHRCLRDKRQN